MESRLERKVEWGSTFKFTRGLPYITSIKFHARTRVELCNIHPYTTFMLIDTLTIKNILQVQNVKVRTH